MEGLGTSRLAALPLDYESSTGTHFNMGINKDLAAFFCHVPITGSCFPSKFDLPEDWIHAHSSEVLLYQRPSDEIFTEGQVQHNQFGTKDPTPHSGFGSEPGLKLLLGIHQVRPSYFSTKSVNLPKQNSLFLHCSSERMTGRISGEALFKAILLAVSTKVSTGCMFTFTHLFYKVMPYIMCADVICQINMSDY